MEHNQETAAKIRAQLDRITRDPTNPGNDCDLCRDTGYIRIADAGVIRCECQKRKIINARLADIPKRFRNCAFANYLPNNGRQQKALDQVAGEFTASYFIHGDYAQGKTHLATAQYVQLIRIERAALFFTMAELMAELRKSEMDADYFCLVRQRARHADSFHLFIDDIDKFKITDFKFEVLFDLIDSIYKRSLTLTVTSNCALSQLTNVAGVHPSIVRRLDDLCMAVEV